MTNSAEKITGYVWYNPDMGLYQKGKKEEFEKKLDRIINVYILYDIKPWH